MSRDEASLFLQFDELCDRFEAGWKAGERPQIEAYLHGADDAQRPALLKWLLPIELRYRAIRDEHVSRLDYCSRFPAHAEVVDLVFRELETAPAHGGVEKTPSTPPADGVCPGPETRSYSPATASAHGPNDAGSTTKTAAQDQQTLGDYVLLEKLGAGGMGVVWKALERSTNRLVALKLIRTEKLEELPAAQRQEWLERFKVEGQACARLQHDNIVTVYRVGQIGDQHFYAMRLVDGESLADLVHRHGPMENHRAAACVQVVAQAVHYAHTCGVLHRDLKPRNILLDSNDRPFVADFGLAKTLDVSRGVTQTGQVIGTPEYMPPEQVRDSTRVTVSSDVYSLGATLYDLLAGCPPFRGETVIETLNKVLHDEPTPPRQCNPGIDRDLEIICLKAMAKEPARRYPSAAAFAEDLRRYLNTEPIHARPASRLERAGMWARRNPVVALLTTATFLLLASVAGVATWAYFRAAADARSLQSQLAEGYLDQAQFECQAGAVGPGLLHMAKGLQTAPEADLQLIRRIRLNLDAWRNRYLPAAVILQHDEEVRSVAFSPDGERVLTGTLSATRLWDAKHGTKLLEVPHGSSVAFSPEGDMFATAGNNVVRIWDAQNGRQLKPELLRPASANSIRAVAFSPDGQTVLTGGEDAIARLWRLNDGKQLAEFQHDRGYVLSVAFSPDGQLALTSGQDYTARVWQIQTGKLVWEMKHEGYVFQAGFIGDSRVLTGSVKAAQLWQLGTGVTPTTTLPHKASVFSLSVSPDGARTLTACDDGVVRLWNTFDGERLAEFPHEVRVWSVAFSPDGQSAISGSVDKTARIWQLPRAGGTSIHDFGHRNAVRSARFSRDGRKILTSSADGTVRVWDAKSGAQIRAWEFRHRPHAFFTPDGSTVLTVSGNLAQLWREDVPQPVKVFSHASNVAGSAIHPDGLHFVTCCENGSLSLWSIETGDVVAQRQLDTYAGMLLFSPNGQYFLASSIDHTAQVLRTRDLETTATLKHPAEIHHVAWSADSSKFASACLDGRARVWHVAAASEPPREFEHGPTVWDVAFSPDGQKLLTGSSDKSARLWDLTTGQLIRSVQQRGQVVRVMFRRDGQLIATGDALGEWQLWDEVTGKPIGPAMEHEWAASHADFSPDGRFLVTATQGILARLWRVPQPMEGTPEQITLWAQALTGTELDDDGVVRQLDADTIRQHRLELERQTNGRLRIVQSTDTADPRNKKLEWHRRRAAQCERCQDWQRALFHLDALAQLEPGHWEPLLQRGSVHANLGHYDDALSDLSAAIERNPTHSQVWYERGQVFARLARWPDAADDYLKSVQGGRTSLQVIHECALVQLAAGREANYREIADQFLTQAEAALSQNQRPTDLDLLNMAAWTAVIGPNAIKDPERLVHVAERAAAAAGNRHAVLNTLGTALYRAGRYQEAIDRLQAGITAHENKTGGPHDWLVLAMAHHRLGHAAEARQWLDKAFREIEKQTAPPPAGATSTTRQAALSWTERLELDLFRREAEALLSQEND